MDAEREEKMSNYRMTIQYDGSRYNGWQRQVNTKNTIQEKIEAILMVLMEREIKIHGSGRTDAGVHSLGQTANFHGNTNKTMEQIKDYLNQYLPEDICVSDVKEASDRFHSRLNVVKKVYRYRIQKAGTYHVMNRKYVMQAEGDLNIDAIRKAADTLIGEHDFMSFCANRRMKKSTIRTIHSIDVQEVEDEVVIDYCGNGFLHQMVRIITGTLVEVGMGVKNPEEMIQILNGKDRSLAGFSAPAKGLTLLEVIY